MSLFPWQTEQWQQVEKQLQSGLLPHAYLFSGLEGIGKFDFAKHLAKSLLCEDSRAKSTSEPCGHCKQCKLLNAGTHPDLKIIEPEDASSVLKIDTIRALVGFFQQSSLQGGRKVAILFPAEALNINAANALLKTLEEPTSDSIIILVCHSVGQLLPTIRSRCQVLDFNVPPINQAIKWLAEQESFDKGFSEKERRYTDADFDGMLNLASGAPLRARQYLKVNALEENKLMLDELARLLKKEVIVSSISDRWNDDISSLRLTWVIQWIAELVKIKMMTLSPEQVVNIEKRHAGKMFYYLAQRSSAQQLFGLYKESLKEYKLFLGSSNPNKLLSFEYLLNRWSDLMRKT